MNHFEDMLFGNEGGVEGQEQHQPKCQPLPGFDADMSCPICKVVRSKLKCTNSGATLAEFIEAAHSTFVQHEGRPEMDIAEDVLEQMKHYVDRHPGRLKSLRFLTPLQVHRHFVYNHDRKAMPNYKEFMLQVMFSMLHVTIRRACDEDGMLFREQANQILNIIDRIIKLSAMRD